MLREDACSHAPCDADQGEGKYIYSFIYIYYIYVFWVWIWGGSWSNICLHTPDSKVVKLSDLVIWVLCLTPEPWIWQPGMSSLPLLKLTRSGSHPYKCLALQSCLWNSYRISNHLSNNICNHIFFALVTENYNLERNWRPICNLTLGSKLLSKCVKSSYPLVK